MNVGPANAGNDVLVFDDTFGTDTVANFDAIPADGSDILTSPPSPGSPPPTSPPTSRSSRSVCNTLITIAGDGTITLQDVAASTVTIADFVV